LNVGRIELSELAPGLKDEQPLAIKTMLTSGLSYVWGPPGTGKTKWVLAKAVRYCIEQGKKVLVLASTNLAVDNALSAILEEGISKEDVIRIGLATPLFIQQYPECIEERAYQSEIRQTQSQIKTFENNISSLQRAIQLEQEIKPIANEIETTRYQLNELQSSLVAVQENETSKRNAASKLKDELSKMKNQVHTTQQKLCTYDFVELLSTIKTLEEEQTKSIKGISEQQNQLTSIGLFASLFLRKKQQHLDSISRQEKHLLSVEETLRSKRKDRERLAPIVSLLESELKKMEPIYTELHRDIAESYRDIGMSEKRQLDLRSSISVEKSKVHHLESQFQRLKEDLANIGDDPSVDRDEQLLVEWQSRIDELKYSLAKYKQNLSQKTVLGMTLDGFIGLTAQMGIVIDQIFIDEAPYAPLAKVLPLLSLNRPISMLGDHRQLPPVCECNNDEVVRSYWAKPAIFLEDAFRYGNNWAELNGLENPQFELTQQSILTVSYRYGQSLASLLDRHIYGNIGLTGVAPNNTAIKLIHCVPINCPNRRRWQNPSEVDAIIEKIKTWWEWAQQEPGMPTLAVLTPYKSQVKLVRQRLFQLDAVDKKIRDHVEVWNTHKAQGREWDCVLFSVSDTRNLEGNGPFLTDSNLREGRAVLNTTISRTKQHLIIFLDQDFWAHRTPQSLLTDLANR
jgi:hypothetical protein